MHAVNEYFLILVITLAASNSVWASGTIKPTAAEECSAFSGAGMRECLEKKASASAVELKQTENMVRKTLDKWDEDVRYGKIAQSTFDASNKEFLRYRDAQCGFNASLAGGAIGAAHEMWRLACIVELNISRVQQIKDAVSRLPLK